MPDWNNTTIVQQLFLILISIIIGLFIGAEREYRNKSAGLRTFILISFGSCVFTILSLKIGIANPDRLAANVLTGIGFLGAGVIFKDDNKVAGITTATTIWATASLGMCVGSGNIGLGVLGTILVLFVLNYLYFLQDFIDNRHKIRDYQITIISPKEINILTELFNNLSLKTEIISENYDKNAFTAVVRLTGNIKNHKALVLKLRNNSSIISYKF